ncbi:MAG: hypothetical protein KKI12_02555 [Proteobacteria bacterium]|nr:hypothetical protein [Pseudomonadota bacterium]MBU4287034.1 hypothetical protein [Pseudomonadota bacterium]MCG2757566.1 hypothetical protein [Desulfobacteraceae bacterium]
MKKLLPLIILLLIPSTCIASYIIKLKSGSEIIVYSYWREGNKILFHYYGGTVGFPNDSIESIDELSEHSDFPDDIIPGKKIKYEKTAEIDESRPTSKDLETKNKVDGYKNKKISLVNRLKNQQKKLEQDISRGKEKMWIERRKRKIKDISTEIDNLAKEIMEKNNGILPDWWHDISVPPAE